MAAGGTGPGTAGAAGDLVTGGRWQVTIEPEDCIGCGSCVALAPDVFRFDGTHSTTRRKFVPPCDDVLAAAESCPAEAIRVHDAVTGRLIAPCG